MNEHYEFKVIRDDHNVQIYRKTDGMLVKAIPVIGEQSRMMAVQWIKERANE